MQTALTHRVTLYRYCLYFTVYYKFIGHRARLLYASIFHPSFADNDHRIYPALSSTFDNRFRSRPFSRKFPGGCVHARF